MKAMREHYYRQLEKVKGLIEFIDFTLLKTELNMSVETIQYLKQKREGYLATKEYCLNKIEEHEED
jgi:hypothetical protein